MPQVIRLQLGEGEIYLVSIYPEEQWWKDFQDLLKRIQRRTQKRPSQAIEADITTASAEVEAKRRKTCRSH
jgi:hypothetical protein